MSDKRGIAIYLDKKFIFKKLKGDINYTMAIKSNMLYMNGIISQNELDRIEFAREKRNKITHANFEFQDKFSFHEIYDIVYKVFLCFIWLFAKI